MNVNVEVQDEQLRGLNLTPDRLRLEMAAGLYASEALTLGQASAIAGLSQPAFLRELGRRGICVHYGVTDYEEDLRTLDRLRTNDRSEQGSGAPSPHRDSRAPVLRLNGT